MKDEIIKMLRLVIKNEKDCIKINQNNLKNKKHSKFMVRVFKTSIKNSQESIIVFNEKLRELL